MIKNKDLYFSVQLEWFTNRMIEPMLLRVKKQRWQGVCNIYLYLDILILYKMKYAYSWSNIAMNFIVFSCIVIFHCFIFKQFHTPILKPTSQHVNKTTTISTSKNYHSTHHIINCTHCRCHYLSNHCRQNWTQYHSSSLHYLRRSYQHHLI